MFKEFKIKGAFLIYYLFFSCVLMPCNAQANEAQNNATGFDHSAAEFSKNSWWYGKLAKDQFRDKDYKGAIINFTNAIEIDEDIPDFYYYRGNAYTFNQQPRKALADFKKALQLNPDYLSALNNMGWEYLKRREFRNAFRYFVGYLKLMPKDPKMLFGLSFSSEYTTLFNILGWESLRKNDLTRSLRYFNSYLKIAPKDPDAQLGTALVYFYFNDYENAALYLDKAKNIEPSLYQGFSGIKVLEKSGYTYNEEDKVMLEALFLEVNDKKRDFQNLTTASVGKFLFGFIYIFLGLGALLIFLVRIKKSEGYIFYLVILNLSFGLKLLYDNPMIRLTELPTPEFWAIAIPFVSFLIPISFILFIRYFIGWGWKYSILGLLIYYVVEGIVEVVVSYSAPAQDIYGSSNIIFGLLAVIVLFLHLFLPSMRKNKEVQIISVGLGFYLSAILYDNLAINQWLPIEFSFAEPAYMFFNICLIYVAFRRISNTEKEFFAVKQDLETARKIQNAILPETNPKGANYEVSSAYLPMALIGGDYYDYQQHDDSHIGVLIADVSGHGISAALIASMLKVAFTSQSSNSHHPALVLEQMNNSLIGQLNNEFITAGYLGIDLVTKELTYSSAGHPPMVLYRRENNKISEIAVAGIPMGIFEETKFKETSLQLIKGDRLVLYTDGISDVFSPSGEAFGKQRFIDLIEKTKHSFVKEAVKIILDSLREWSGKEESEPHEDDITLIIFDIT